MKEIIEKLVSLEKDISKGKGDFELFALFLREGAPDVWDLVVSAPWMEKDKSTTIEYLAKQLLKYFNPQEMVKFSRIVPIEQSNPGLKDVYNAIYLALRVKHGVDVRVPIVVTDNNHAELGVYELQNCNFFGLEIKHAYIITSKPQKRSHLESVAVQQG